MLLYVNFCLGQTDNCTPDKLVYKNLSKDFKGKALVVDAQNSLGFWKTDSPVNVCWENIKDYEKFNTERNAVERAITNTWQQYSALTFSGWKKCKSDNEQGIHITVKDTQPVTECLGAALNAKKDGMTLNFNFTDSWGKGIKRQYTSENNGVFNKIKLIEILAIHEFGHAIGLAHFQGNSTCSVCNEFPDFQKKDKQDKIGLWLVRSCQDTYSVMNYCLTNYLSDGDLSPYDKDIIGVLYGYPKRKEDKKFSFRYSVVNTGVAVKSDKSITELYSQLRNENSKSVRSDRQLTKEEQKRLEDFASQQPRIEQQQVQQAFKDIQANWSHVFVKLVGSKDDLKEVEYVQYYLYEKMVDDNYNPVKGQETNFNLSYFAWGRFQIKAAIKLKNKEELLYDYITPDIPDFIWVDQKGSKHTGGAKNQLSSSTLSEPR